jgi:pyruvate dehydrogenase E2 component (dihydrolipoyllysine-residue acetyltransferase)
VAQTVTMPQLGETVVEGTITKWLKKAGETVERDEPLFEISTDKVDTEVPSPVAGTIVEIKVQEGETVQVGTELAVIDSNGDGQGTQAEAPAADVEAAPQEASQSEPDTGLPAEPEEKEPAAAADTSGPKQDAPPGEDEPQTPEAAQAAPTPAAAPASDGNGQGREDVARQAAQTAGAEEGPRSHILSPLVRRLAEENDVDLSQVQGSGTGGRITKQDVMAFVRSRSQAPAQAAAPAQAPAAAPAAQPAQAAPAPAAPRAIAQGREEVIPLSRMRQAIAKHMVASIQTTARAWNAVEVNMESVVRTRAAAKDAFKEREGISLTYMPFVARAVCEALLAFPDVNAELREDQLIRKHYVNLGIAVALDDGLIVPVVKGADEMNLMGLARAINDVATRARNKKLNPDDVHGSTFTITNPGPFGSIMSVPIINQPNCGILAFDAVEKRAVVIDDAVAIRHMVFLSMSWDHRVIDGATAAKFLARLKSNLETWDFGPELGLPARGA